MATAKIVPKDNSSEIRFLAQLSEKTSSTHALWDEVSIVTKQSFFQLVIGVRKKLEGIIQILCVIPSGFFVPLNVVRDTYEIHFGKKTWHDTGVS